MKPLLRFVLALCAGLFVNAAGATTRMSEPINRDWTFTLGDPAGAQAEDPPQADWRRVDLPHSFSEPYFLGTGFYVGHGWYRKNLDVPASAAGKRISLEFDGVFQDAEIFVNGRKAGRHVGGYTGFSIDITPYARPGRNATRR
jgi:beta-galactosidase/beta-glucuronidase